MNGNTGYCVRSLNVRPIQRVSEREGKKGASTGECAEVHQVLKVGDAPGTPQLAILTDAAVLAGARSIGQIERPEDRVHLVTLRFALKGKEVRLAVGQKDLERVIAEQVATLERPLRKHKERGKRIKKGNLVNVLDRRVDQLDAPDVRNVIVVWIPLHANGRSG